MAKRLVFDRSFFIKSLFSLNISSLICYDSFFYGIGVMLFVFFPSGTWLARVARAAFAERGKWGFAFLKRSLIPVAFMITTRISKHFFERKENQWRWINEMLGARYIQKSEQRGECKWERGKRASPEPLLHANCCSARYSVLRFRTYRSGGNGVCA